MTSKTKHASTPFYVVRSGVLPFYPKISFDDPETNCVCVYGFSDKPIYDKFISSTDQPLTPYPLVNGYLVNQIEDAAKAKSSAACQRLVILDATDVAQETLSVATMAAVLKAQQEKNPQTPIEFELPFDSSTSSYLFKSNAIATKS